jgi:hypothetical protein
MIMRRKTIKVSLVASALALALVVTAGYTKGATATLTLVNGETTQELTLSKIKMLDSYEGWGMFMRSTGSIEEPFRYKGVPLNGLCDFIGGITPSNAIEITAEDGYSMTLSYNQVMGDDFITYDPVTGNKITYSGELKLVLAYEKDSQPLSEKDGGPLRLCIVNSRSQVTDGHWWIKQVEKIEIKPITRDWILCLEGAITEDMDRGTFESGAAPNCHGATWTDDEGRIWRGVPLWLLVGRVDDEVKHGPGAFNYKLVGSNCEINITGEDGSSHSFNSTDVVRNDNIIVANTLNGNPLPEKYWPLRIIGPNLREGGKIDRIVKIEIISPS